MSCFSQHILDYFYNIQNTGRIIKPEAIGKAGSKLEGTVIEFSWRVKEGVIKDARFRTFGDVNAIAISSIIATMVVGKEVEEVLSIRPEDIFEHLRENKPNYLYFVHLGLEAVANAYENYIKKNKIEAKRENKFASSLRDNLSKIETGELVEEDNYNLSDLGEEEKDYLTNLKAYESQQEEQISSIEKLISNSFGYDNQANGYTNSLTKSVGRGRPRKERSLEELEAERNKVSRGRGRPRKERTPEELELMNRPKLSRGRPRKERTPEELEAELNKVSRGRGRPKKERTEEEILALQNKVSRGRGRPRKERTEEEIWAEQNKVSRGRGRPRKERTEEEILAIQNKQSKGRGRPRKIQSSISDYTPKSSFSYLNNINGYSNILSSIAPIEEDKTNEVKTNSFSLFNPADKISREYEEVDENLDDEVEEISIETNNLELEEDSEENYEEEFDNSFESENSLEVKRGRGRPKKERTEEELELMNRPKLSRGRPRKERTPEELEAELNKVSRGRGRPKKERTEEEILALQNKVSRGRGRPRKEVGPTEIDNITEKRGRGRPKKISEELNESENYIANSTKRGRGRPKKYTAIVIQNLKQPNDINDEIKTEEIRQNENTNSNTQSEELVKKVFHEEVISNNEENLSQLNNQQSENNDESENLTNSFAPAQNKYGLGLASLNNVYKTKKVTIRHEEITNSTVTKAEYNFTKTHLNNEEEQPEIEVEKVEQKKENTKDDTKTLKEIMEEDDIEPTEKSSLSENINNILSSGGSIADALKALMEE